MLIEKLYEEAQQALSLGRLDQAIARINEAGRELSAIGAVLGQKEYSEFRPLENNEYQARRSSVENRSKGKGAGLSRARRLIKADEISASELARATALLKVLMNDVAVQMKQVQTQRQSIRKRKAVSSAFDEHLSHGGTVLDLSR